MLKLIALILVVGSMAHAEEIYTVNDKEVSKGDAVRAAALDAKAKIVRHTDLKLSDKGTLVKK